MKNISLLLFVFFSLNLFSQKEANIWYFGENGGLDFNTSPPQAIGDGQLSTREGCSSFSDANGDLLFYSDGTTVYDKNHNIMTYSDGRLANDLRGNSSSTQSGMIVPKPKSSTIFYLFTVDDNNGNNGFNYYTIDMTDGIGKLIDEDGDGVFYEDISSGLANSWTEKVTAVRGAQCNEFWVVSVVNNEFHSFLVSELGVRATPVVSRVANNVNDKRGYLKLSPDGSKLAIATQAEAAILYDFNNATGEVTDNPTFLINNLNQDGEPYGVEFSLDSKKLYISTSSGFRRNMSDNAVTYKLFQFDLTNPDIVGSKTIVHRQDAGSVDFPEGGFRGALQVGPDGRIYVTIPTAYEDAGADAPFIDIIENPTADAADVIFTKNAIRLVAGTFSTQGLPPFISSLLLPIEIIDIDTNTIINNDNLELCVGQDKTIGPEPVSGNNVVFEWRFDNGTTNDIISSDRLLNLTDLQLANSGNYSLKIELVDPCGDVTQYNGEFNMNVFEAAIATPLADIIECDDDRSGSNSYDFLVDTTPSILGSLDPTIFEVLYFDSFVAANDNVRDTNLPNIFDAVTGTTNLIYARVHNINAPFACYDIIDFSIIITDIPTPTQPSVYRLCDDDASGSDTDTISFFRLDTKDSEILGGISATDFNVSYHTSLSGAQTSATTDVIDKTTDHAVTVSQTIFVRVENVDNPNCSVISDDTTGSTFTSFELLVDPLPVVTNPAELIQCHNNPDLDTTVNLKLARINVSTNYTNETFEYYATEAAAIAGTPQITGASIESYPVIGTGEAWVRVISDQNCYRIAKIDITVNFSADLAYDKTFTICDDFLDIDGNDNANNDDTDGISTFDFSETENEIKAFFPAASRPDLDVFYYETESDRASSTNNINSEIANHRNNNDPSFANNQTIYIKIINNTNNGCTGTANVFLQVDTVPIANTLAKPLSFCDDFDSGSSDDGENINIDLRQTVNEILGTTQSETDFIVTYHTSQADASSGNAPILNDTNFRNTAPTGFVPGTVSRQTIYVRVEDRNKVPACFNDHLSFDIEITPLPELQNTIAAIEVCDVPTATDSDPRNRVAQNIDASIRNTDILNGRDPSIFSVRYYKSQTNALVDVDRIAIANLLDYENDPANTFFPLNVNSDEPGIETLFFVIYSSDTGCASEPFTLDIRIYPEPNVPVNINNYTDCDTDNNGLGNDTDGILENIAFSSKITEVLANYTTAEQSNFTVSFHENLVDAQTGNGALDTNAYQNNTNNQTIFVRVLNNQTGCVSDDLSFEIIVNALPSYDPLDLSQVACLNNLPLTLQVDNPLTGYNYSWVENQSGNEISTAQSVDIRAGGTYTLTVTDRVTLCNRTEMFDVIESEAATITSEHVAVIDETAEIFGNNFSITINDTPGILGIGDYEYALLDEQGNFVYGYQDTFVFDQLSGGFYKILVRDKNGCDENGIPASLVVPVVEFPDFFTPNGDGVNDTWNLKGTNSNYYPSSEIYIYNRFGKVIAKVDLSEQGWDGTYNGKRLPSDDYWVSIKLVPFDTTKKTIFKTGNLSLIRK
jgi:gliding motility-associated-like protein